MKQLYGLFLCKCRGEVDNHIPIKDLAKKFENHPEIDFIHISESLCDAIEMLNIQSLLKKHKPDGVILAGCSPRYYEAYFRSVVEKAGTNAGKLVFANIREQIAWVFKNEPRDILLAKAKLAIDVALASLEHSRDFVSTNVKVKNAIGIIGAGIGGIQTALSVARSEIETEIHLVERGSYVGGPQLKYAKAFPRDECSACAISPLISEVASYPNIHVHTDAEVIDCVGRVGDYHLTLAQHPRFVTDKCISCGKCALVCPVDTTEENGTETHKAIFLPFVGTIPNSYKINESNITYCRTLCNQPCITSCPTNAIDLNAVPVEKTLDVGAIVLATGAAVHYPKIGDNEYGYGEIPDVMTLDQYERLLAATSRWKGQIKLLSDESKIPESIVFVLCVERRNLGYCSKYCCLSTAAAIRQTAEKLPDAKIYVFYQDLFADSKFGDDYIRNTQTLPNVQWIRAIPRQIALNENKMVLFVPISGGKVELPVDLLILATGLTPTKDAPFLRHIFGLDSSKDGFYSEFDLLFSPVSTNDIGKFLVGTATGPKTIPETTISAYAVGAQVTNLLNKGEISLPVSVTEVNPDLCGGCGVCIKTCPYHANSIDQALNIAIVDVSRCKSCGNCVVACPANARDLIEYPDRAIRQTIDLLAGFPVTKEDDPQMLAFLCSGCGYPTADNVGLSGAGRTYSTNLSIIRVPCSGRVDPRHILHALTEFDGVMIGACHLHSCQFSVGNFDAQKRVYLLQGTLKSASIDPRRVRIEYFSPTETVEFCQIVNEFEKELRMAIDKKEPQEGEIEMEG
ncbi:MAG: hydrogenase iron-sulfur subunit [Candidatus Hodarchaeota archaeon]